MKMMDTKQTTRKTTPFAQTIKDKLQSNHMRRGLENPFHSPKSGCQHGSCDEDDKVTTANRQQNRMPENDNRENTETPLKKYDNDVVDENAFPDIQNETKTNAYDIKDTDTDTDTDEGIPHCLGGDCDFSNVEDILTDCTGSACPPKTDEWYQLFLGIAKPDHNYFDRNWQSDQTYPRRYKKKTYQKDQHIDDNNQRKLLLKRKNGIETQAKQMNARRIQSPFIKIKSTKGKLNRNDFVQQSLNEDIEKVKGKRNDVAPISDAPKCRDDLCIDSEEISEDFDDITPDEDPQTEFVCPPGYGKESRGGVTFCKPMERLVKTEHILTRKCKGGEQLIRASGREFCVPTKPKTFTRTKCSKDQIPVLNDDGITCIDAGPHTTGVCKNGQMLQETIAGRLCTDGAAPMETVSGFICADGSVPLVKKSFICASPDIKGRHGINGIADLDTSCSEDQVALQTSTGFVCVDKVEPRPMCGPGTTPQIQNGRLECHPDLECPPDQVVVETDSGKVCQTLPTSPDVTTVEPTKPKTFTRTKCSKGQIPVLNDDGITCIDAGPHPTGVCKNGQMLQETMAGRLCTDGATPMETVSGFICADGSVPLVKKSFICASPDTKGSHGNNGIADLDTSCSEDQVALQTSTGFVCVDKVEPRPMCGPGTTPQIQNGRLECHPDLECPPDQVVVETDSGKVCQTLPTSPDVTTVESTTAEPPCPHGLVPLHTSVGRVCQYIPPEGKPSDSTYCPEGKLVKTKEGKSECVNDEPSHHLECPSGQTLIKTERGFKCAHKISQHDNCPSRIFDKHGECIDECPENIGIRDGLAGKQCVPKMKICPFGTVMIDRICYDMRRNDLCPFGQDLVKTSDGFSCIYRQKKSPVHGTKLTSCSTGQILSQAMRMFYCETHTVPPSEVLKCHVGEVFVKIGGGYACITEHEASLKCTERQVLVRLPNGFTCVSMKGKTSKNNEVPHCHGNEVRFTGENGFEACITLDMASTHCGEGYKAVKTGQEFVCRKQKVGIECPQGYVLLFDGETPACVSEMDLDCFSSERVPAPECLQRSPKSPISPCKNGYHLGKSAGIFECFLNDTCNNGQECDQSSCVNQDGVDVRPCDIDPEILLAGCNPDCANGGTCYNGKCLCPKGITGTACNEGSIQCRVMSQGNDYSWIHTKLSNKGAKVHTCKPRRKYYQSQQIMNFRSRVPGHKRSMKYMSRASAECEDMNECQSLQNNICEYHCENTFGSYQCSCPAGMILQTDRRTCRANHCSPDCLNGGSCVGGQCRCPRGFKGHFCQTDVDECGLYGDRLCQHICRNTYGSYSCICPHGTRLNADGRTCTNTTCIPQCRNGGECVNNRCVCATGFYGRVCQLDINECHRDQPCSHSCVNLRGSYMCTCPRGLVLQSDRHTCL